MVEGSGDLRNSEEDGSGKGVEKGRESDLGGKNGARQSSGGSRIVVWKTRGGTLRSILGAVRVAVVAVVAASVTACGRYKSFRAVARTGRPGCSTR
jgi:hypothetical protein